MASRVFLDFQRGLMEAEHDLAGIDVRVALLMSNNDAATVADTAAGVNMDDVSLDECDDTGGPDRQSLTTEAVAVDDANNRVEFDDSGAAAAVFGSGDAFSGDASRNYTGVLVYKHVTNDTDSIPMVWIEFGSALNSTSTEVTVTWNAEGILQMANA